MTHPEHRALTGLDPFALCLSYGVHPDVRRKTAIRLAAVRDAERFLAKKFRRTWRIVPSDRADRITAHD